MTWVGIGLRWLHLVAIVQAAGSMLFLWLVATPALDAAHIDTTRRVPVHERLRRLGAFAAVVAVLTGAGTLVSQAAAVTGHPDSMPSLAVVGQLLTSTQYGRVWSMRIGLLLLLGGALWLRPPLPDGPGRRSRLVAAAILGVGAVVLLAWAGHATTVEEWGGLMPLVDAAHLLGTGTWLGGLLPLALLLRQAHRCDDRARAALVRALVRRFSNLALVSVSVLVATGTFSAWGQVRTIPALLGTPYGQLLLVKLALVAVLLGLGAMNLLGLKPRLMAQVPARILVSTTNRLRRNVILEAGLGLGGLLLVVGALTVTPPARHVDPVWPLSSRLAWDVTKDLPGVRTRVLLGTGAAAAGLVLTSLGLLRHARRRGIIAIAGGAAVVLGLSAALPPLAIDAYPTTFLRPGVPYTALSIVRGQHRYREACLSCHGVAGWGDGPAAAGLRPPPADLTARHATDHTVGDMYWWLTHGKPGSAMPPFGDRLSPEERWNVLNFVRTLSAAEQARPFGPVVVPDPLVVAPDFPYTTTTGESHTLRDLRGRVVLLVFYRLPEAAERLQALASQVPALERRETSVLAIPLTADADRTRPSFIRSLPYPVLTDNAEEVAAAYTLFRRDLSPDGLLPEPPAPHHMELLVDRQGYLRARWIPGAGPGWSEATRLLAEVDRLAKEPPAGSPPDEHIH